MVAYDQDSNAILAHPIKTRSEYDLLTAMTAIHTYLKVTNIGQWMPSLVKQFFKQENASFQLVPPNLHRNNAAEKAMGTFKDYFVAILCSCDLEFPMYLWCCLVAQATTTLNILQKSNINPVYQPKHNWTGRLIKSTPLAPPGYRVVIYENPKKRKTWAPHGVDG